MKGQPKETELCVEVNNYHIPRLQRRQAILRHYCRCLRTYCPYSFSLKLHSAVLNEACLFDREGGMDVSLFKRLSERHPHAVVSLEHQYRMNQDIMKLSNTLIYENRLKCGTESVARAVLELPDWDELLSYIKENTTGKIRLCFE